LEGLITLTQPSPSAFQKVGSSPPPPHLFDVKDGAEPPAPGQGPEDLHGGVLALGVGLVLAALAGHAHLRVALVHQHAVDALRVHAARVLVRRLAVAARHLRQVRRDDLHLSDWPVDLEEGNKKLPFSF